MLWETKEGIGLSLSQNLCCFNWTKPPQILYCSLLFLSLSKNPPFSHIYIERERMRRMGRLSWTRPPRDPHGRHSIPPAPPPQPRPPNPGHLRCLRCSPPLIRRFLFSRPFAYWPRAPPPAFRGTLSNNSNLFFHISFSYVLLICASLFSYPMTSPRLEFLSFVCRLGFCVSLFVLWCIELTSYEWLDLRFCCCLICWSLGCSQVEEDWIVISGNQNSPNSTMDAAMQAKNLMVRIAFYCCHFSSLIWLS